MQLLPVNRLSDFADRTSRSTYGTSIVRALSKPCQRRYDSLNQNNQPSTEVDDQSGKDLYQFECTIDPAGNLSVRHRGD